MKSWHHGVLPGSPHPHLCGAIPNCMSTMFSKPIWVLIWTFWSVKVEQVCHANHIDDFGKQTFLP
ncbi:MAG: hypothetical protein FD135_4172 [Comamonadaceae bacterium]|nr:MAG: hypothetical protein FD135_4172 [Comamonadaceae bacterium]